MAISNLKDLIEEIKADNATNSPRMKNIEADGRNSRRHLLEMKKSVFKIEDAIRLISEPDKGLTGAEKEMLAEQRARDERMIAALEKLSMGSVSNNAGNTQKSSGGGLGAMLSGVTGALGAGAAGLGIGLMGIAAIAGVGIFLADTLQDIDTAKIKQNVTDLLSIGDELNDGDLMRTLGEGGTFFLVMTGIGLGLGVFAAGQAAATAAQRFEKDGWTDKIKDNVKDLLSISDELGGKLAMLGEGAVFTLVMTGIGTGLAAFSVGQGAAAAVDKFSTANWSKKIKDNVVTLLSISDEVGGKGEMLKEGGTFALAMTGLGYGLAAFAVGQGATAATGGMAGVLEQFTGDGWAEAIKTDVKTLLSITDLPGVGKDTAAFVLTMGGISAGLMAFAVGQGANVAATGLSEAVGLFTGEGDFAQRIKDQVATLLSIVKENEGIDTVKFVATMGGLSAGILAFTASDALGTLGDAGQKILGFFGVKSPFQKIMDVADNADKLKAGARALRSIGRSLKDFNDISFDGDNFNMEEFADDLKAAVPTIEKAVMGDDGGWFGTRIAGLANTGDSYQQAARNIEALMEALELGGPSGQTAAAASGGGTTINNYYGGGRTVLPGDGAPGRGRIPRP